MTSFGYCYICDVQLNLENNSKEHLIPCVIGGKEVSKNLLCKICNNKLGRILDVQLEKIYKFFMNQLRIKRERYGAKHGVPDFAYESVLDKKKFLIDGNNNTIEQIADRAPEKHQDEDGNKYMSFCNEQQAKQWLKWLKKQNITNVDLSLTITPEFAPIIPTSFHYGSPELEAILKIAVNCYIHQGGNIVYIKAALSLLKDCIKKEAINGNEIFGYVRLSKKAYDPKPYEVSHVISIIADPIEKIAYAYIELFNAFFYLVKLSTDYQGQNIKYKSILNLDDKVISCHEQNILNYTRQDIIQQFDLQLKQSNYKDHENSLKRIFSLVKLRSIDHFIELQKSLKNQDYNVITDFINKICEDSRKKVVTSLKKIYGHNKIDNYSDMINCLQFLRDFIDMVEFITTNDKFNNCLEYWLTNKNYAQIINFFNKTCYYSSICHNILLSVNKQDYKKYISENVAFRYDKFISALNVDHLQTFYMRICQIVPLSHLADKFNIYIFRIVFSISEHPNILHETLSKLRDISWQSMINDTNDLIPESIISTEWLIEISYRYIKSKNAETNHV
jgi:hypothetical protein